MPKYRIKMHKRTVLGSGRVTPPYRSMVVEQDKRPVPAKGMKVKRVG